MEHTSENHRGVFFERELAVGADTKVLVLGNLRKRHVANSELHWANAASEARERQAGGLRRRENDMPLLRPGRQQHKIDLKLTVTISRIVKSRPDSDIVGKQSQRD
jgi:hypothetical protein